MDGRRKSPGRLVKILIPLDASVGSAAAIDYALSLGKSSGASVEVLRIRGHQGPEEVCATILRAAASSDADLIVTGLGETTKAAAHAGDDLASRLARGSSCPVIAVHASMEPATPSASVALERPRHG